MHAVVTGHSAGLGAEICAALLRRGASVLGLSRRSNADLAARFGARLGEHAIDLASPQALEALVTSALWSDFLSSADVAILVNNAGILAPIAQLGSEGTASIFNAVQANVAAPLALSDAFARASEACRERRILHVSSGAARTPYAGWGVYCATKAALDHHARVIALEAPSRLLVASVAPGVVDTGMQAQIRACDASRFPSVDRFKALATEGQLQSAAECAERLTAFLLSDKFGHEPVADLRTLG